MCHKRSMGVAIERVAFVCHPDVGADFSMDIEIGEDTFTKQPNVLEELA